jgi:hypothetical protein
MSAVTLAGMRYGVEIETSCDNYEAVRAIHEVVGGETYSREVVDTEGRTWEVKYDSSIRGEPCEVVTPPLRYEELPLLMKVVRSLRRHGARVNGSCGLHIHVDAGPMDANALRNLFLLVYREENTLFRAFGVSDARANQFTRPAEDGVKDRMLAKKRMAQRSEVAQAWYGTPIYLSRSQNHYDGTRYHGLNLHSTFFRGTVEFRYFNGTLNALKIKAFVQMVLALTKRAMTMRDARRCAVRKPVGTKYDMRCLMIELGLIGAEYEGVRAQMLAHLEGSSRKKSR